MGLLKLTGNIDITQFWPGGKSDADTTNVLVNVTQGAFQFQNAPGEPFIVSHVFDNAEVKGRQRKKVVHAGKVTVRLQGIDAPELHYKIYGKLDAAIPKGTTATPAQHDKLKALNVELRQPLAQTATEALGTFLKTAEIGNLPCEVTTQVDVPNDVFDTYGRFVGDILVSIDGQTVDLNRWLLQNGWVFPTFYSSMTDTEINTLIQDAAVGKKKAKSVWKYYKASIGTLDQTLRYEKGDLATFKPYSDKGAVIFPKLYRRLYPYSNLKEAGIIRYSFTKYIADRKEGCFLTTEFLEQGVSASTPYRLDEFIKRGRFSVGPGDLVFQEASSTLVDDRGNNVTAW